MYSYKNSKEYILNYAAKYISKTELMSIAAKLEIALPHKVTRETIVRLMDQKVGFRRICKLCEIGISSYEIQNEFDITNDEVRKLYKAGYLKPVRKVKCSSNGYHYDSYIYDVFDCYRLTKEIVDKYRKVEEHQKENRRNKKIKEAKKKLDEALLKEIVNCDNPSGIIVFDVETTGLSPDDEVIQISIIDGDENVLINEYVKPYVKTYWPNAAKVNGITSDMVRNCPTADAFIPKVLGIFDSAKTVISYNGDFDLGFLKEWGVNLREEQTHVDVMKEFAPIYGEWNEYYNSYKWQSLIKCAKYYGYEFDAHDALEDVRATLYCYNKIRMT